LLRPERSRSKESSIGAQQIRSNKPFALQSRELRRITWHCLWEGFPVPQLPQIPTAPSQSTSKLLSSHKYWHVFASAGRQPPCYCRWHAHCACPWRLPAVANPTCTATDGLTSTSTGRQPLGPACLNPYPRTHLQVTYTSISSTTCAHAAHISSQAIARLHACTHASAHASTDGEVLKCS